MQMKDKTHKFLCKYKMFIICLTFKNE